MFNYVVFPQIQQNKDCNILNTFDNTVACASQAKKSMKQPNRKSILHMTNKNNCLFMKEQLTAVNKKHGNSEIKNSKLNRYMWHISLFLPHPIYRICIKAL